MTNAAETSLLGGWGESVAGAYLRRRGYRLLGVNHRCRGGEVDIIARKGRFIVFVEVKMRKNADFAQAREFVTPAKQGRIILAAQSWLMRNPSKLQPRFDVIEVYAPEGYRTKDPTINHIKNAFDTFS